MRKIVVTHPFGNTRDKLINLCTNRMKEGKGFLYILPSRESIFEVREKILDCNSGIVNSDIVTFFDLEEKILRNGRNDVKTISDIESKIILRKALENIDLNYFNRITDKKGFINQVMSVIKLLKRNNIKPKDESKLISDIEDLVLNNKFRDVFKIYTNYEVIKGDFLDMDDISIESSRYTDCDLINSKDVIVIDGYINIDPVDFNFIDSILKSFKGDVIVSVPFSSKLVYNFIQGEIILPFQNRGFYLETNTQYSPVNPLQELALKFGSTEKLQFPLQEEIIFNDSPCIEDEVRRCGRFIKEKLLSESMEINDIAVAFNSEEYKNKLLEVFEEYGIPIRMPSIINLNETGLFKEMLTLLRLKDVKDNELKLVLSSPFFSKHPSAYQILSLYDFNIEMHTELEDESEIGFTKEEIECAFELYIKVIHLVDRRKEMDCIDYLKYALEYLKVEDNILSFSVDNIKTYLAISSMLDEISTIRDRWGLSINENQTQELLIEGAGSLGITVRKSKSYGVNILNTDHFKGNKYKLICALGLNEGVIPCKFKGNALLSLNEREFLQDNISLISPSFELKREKIRFNLMLSAAKEQIYLSYLTSSDSGDYMIKSPYLSEVQRLLGVSGQNSHRTMRDRFNISTREVASLNEASFYCNIHKTDAFNIKYLNSVSYNPIRNIKEIGKLNTSPRKIEAYGVCPFRFFVEDIMNLKSFNSEDFLEGNISHNVLREYYKALGSAGEFSFEEYERIFLEVVNNFKINTSEFLDKIFIDELKEILKSFICADIEIFNNFKAENKGIEVKFLEKNFIKLEVSGRVDRVDLIQVNGNYTGEYVIHDYKFSSSHTDIKKIAYLEKLQLAVYRWIINDKVSEITGKEAKCVAILYRPLKTAIKGDRTLHGVVLKEYGKNFGFKGAAHFVIEENLEKLYDHLDEAIHEIRLLIKTGKINTVLNCNSKSDFMYPCPVGNLCREGV